MVYCKFVSVGLWALTARKKEHVFDERNTYFLALIHKNQFVDSIITLDAVSYDRPEPMHVGSICESLFNKFYVRIYGFFVYDWGGEEEKGF